MGETKRWQYHEGNVLDTVKEFNVIECVACGFKHIIPIPTSNELEQIYKEEYYSLEKPLYLERRREDIEWWDLVYSERYDTFEENLPSKRRRILDVGSGPGYFLLHGKERGWKAIGIEPSSQAAKYSRNLGLDIREMFFTKQTAQELEKFDVVHMSEVLEHILDPKEMLHIAKSLLLPDGLICIVVPNDYNPFQSALREACDYDPWWVAPPHHINYFDFDSLERLLKSLSIEIILKESTIPIDLFLLMGDNYVGNDKLGRECHQKRKNFEINMNEAGMNGIKRRLYQNLAGLGLGREVQIIAKIN